MQQLTNNTFMKVDYLFLVIPKDTGYGAFIA